MQYFPDKEAFTAAYSKGKPQLVWSSFLADLETPVSAILKLKELSPYHLLFESVEGGETRARYSIIALDPDVIWRCVDGKAEINRKIDKDSEAFTVDKRDVFDSLRKLIQESHIDIPEELPPMASGLFGYMGYDMVKLMEELPDENPDTLGIPLSIYMRPRITVIFDSVKDQAMIITPVWPQQGIEPEDAYRAATERVEDIVATLESTLERSLFSRYYAGELEQKEEVSSNTTQEAYHAMV